MNTLKKCKILVAACGLLIASCHVASSQEAFAEDSFLREVVPFLKVHCYECHNADEPEGGIAFEKYNKNANVQESYDLWEQVIRLLNEHQMPPADQPQPSKSEIAKVSLALETVLESFDCSADKHPGRVTIRRLNKAEYNNTIRDLTGLDLKLADGFPSDDVGEGFDNIGDVLSLPPILLEKYLEAAYTVADGIFEDTKLSKRIFPHESASDNLLAQAQAARLNIQHFASRAFRRPVTQDEQVRLFTIMRDAWGQDAESEEIYKTVVVAVLTSPHFLFRIEKDPEQDDEDGIRKLDGFELASRLSYFLWSSMPDQRLMDLAKTGKLMQRDVLVTETKRMLQDPKATALVENFAGQWLQLRDVTRLEPDPDLFPSFDDELQQSMRRETELFFQAMITEDRNVLEFLTADFTYVDQRLASHYGMRPIKEQGFQRVKLLKGRRGILTHASILMLTSNPTRTSPVKRGKWILDNILAEPPPPPPADVPELEEGIETLGSLREQMEQHRANESCAVCHRTMDALGFGLENFDAIGAWRNRDGKFEIDASGELPGGISFDGADGLMKILTENKAEQFCRCLAQKLLIYGLGRGLTTYDRCVINDAYSRLQTNEYRFSELVIAIITSDPFMMREAVSVDD
ncbi:MAG: hypothetical protein CMM07_27325 [Rhodopirellula sp.]|nr:hypothetical protein [Rhodopirellula sp.]